MFVANPNRRFGCLLVLTIAGCGGGSSTDSTAPAPAPPSPPADVDPVSEFAAELEGLGPEEFLDVAYKGVLARSPESVVALTLQDVVPVDAVSIDQLGDNYRRNTFAMYAIALERLQQFDRSSLSAELQRHFDVFEWHLDDVATKNEFFYYDLLGAYSIFGVQNETTRFFTDLHPLDNVQDVRAFLARLEALDRKFAELEAYLLAQRNQGITEPRLSVQAAVAQLDEIVNSPADAHPIYQAFDARLVSVPDISDEDRTAFRASALELMRTEVLPAYQSLRDRLANLATTAPAAIGVGRYPRGDEYYAYILRHYTTSTLDAPTIHALGLSELERIHSEMRERFDTLGYPQDESLNRLFSRVAADGGTVSAANALARFEDLIAFAEANLSAAFDILPAAPVRVAPDPFGGFYIGPSFDGSRPGTFYAGTGFSQPYFPMPSLAFHEALPGHHLQIAIAIETPDIPVFRKIVRSTGFVEGWALYAERLAYELGWYDNDIYGDLGRLQFEALRAARLVLDTGIHYYGWSFEQAVQFGIDNVGQTPASARAAALRYSVNPGQATAYMVGMLQILAERERAMEVLGDDFDLVAFHRALLTAGGVPLTILPVVVDDYIAEAATAQ